MHSQPIVDSHLHIIDPRFPLVPNQGYLPPTFTSADYLRAAEPLGVRAGVVVSGSFQAFDQTYLKAALAELGDTFVAVTQLPADTPDERILELHGWGVRAIRFNLHRGASVDAAQVESWARRVFDLAGWHVELYADAAQLQGELESVLTRLPRVALDHLGLTGAGLPVTVRLAEAGVKVKATGFGRVEGLDVQEALHKISSANPSALMFGTDMPSTRARRPFEPGDIRLLQETLGEVNARKALWDNAAELYRLDPKTGRR
jgi:predicted TIM-barrel fold metal-dependent hydrolase